MEKAKVISIEPQRQETIYECTWAEVNQPGVYVEVGSGDLYRIPKEALGKSATLSIRKESTGNARLLRLSNNPYLTTLEARFIACEHNIAPNF